MRMILLYLIALIVSAIISTPSAAAGITAAKSGSRIDVSVNGRLFTSYCFASDEKYPYFFPLNGPVSGSSVTSLRNALYPHHTSLFFGCDLVNGGNYWQEGLERGRIISVNAQIDRQGGDTVIISDECIWSRPEALSPVKDLRKYIITSPSPSSILIDVEISIVTLMDVHILKTNHSLFSARIAADLSVENGGVMINAEGIKGEKETFGKPSAWIDCYNRRNNAVEGLAILQHPSNPCYPSPWFTRDYGFISPTPLYWPENGSETSLASGTRLLLRYRVIIHAGDHIQANIAGSFSEYVKTR